MLTCSHALTCSSIRSSFMASIRCNYVNERELMVIHMCMHGLYGDSCIPREEDRPCFKSHFVAQHRRHNWLTQFFLLPQIWFSPWVSFASCWVCTSCTMRSSWDTWIRRKRYWRALCITCLRQKVILRVFVSQNISERQAQEKRIQSRRTWPVDERDLS